MTEASEGARQVRVLNQQRLAASWNRVLRGTGVSLTAKRTQGHAGCVLEPRYETSRGADVVFWTEGRIGVDAMARKPRSTGVEERGMHARVPQEPGRSQVLRREEDGMGAVEEEARAAGLARPSGAKDALGRRHAFS